MTIRLVIWEGKKIGKHLIGKFAIAKLLFACHVLTSVY